MASKYISSINDWTVEAQIDFYCRRILVHSIIYYQMDSNVITDGKYDAMSKLLVRLLQGNRDKLENCYYGEVFKDFDGNTGFDLYDKLTPEHQQYLTLIASHVLYNYRQSNTKKETEHS